MRSRRAELLPCPLLHPATLQHLLRTRCECYGGKSPLQGGETRQELGGVLPNSAARGDHKGGEEAGARDKREKKGGEKMATGGNRKGGGGSMGRRAGGGRRGGRAGQGARKRRRPSASSLGNSRRKDTNLPEIVKSHQFKKQSLQIVDSDKILIDGSGRHLTSRVHRVAT